MTLNAFDWVVLIALAAALFLGYRRGLVLQLVSLLSLFVAWLTAYLFYDDIAPIFRDVVPVEAFVSYTGYEFVVKGLSLDRLIVNALSFVLIFMAVKLGLSVAGHALNTLMKVPGLNMINRWAGGALGFLEAAAVTAVAVQIMALLPNDSVQHWLAGSLAAPHFMDVIPHLLDLTKS